MRPPWARIALQIEQQQQLCYFENFLKDGLRQTTPMVAQLQVGGRSAMGLAD